MHSSQAGSSVARSVVLFAPTRGDAAIARKILDEAEISASIHLSFDTSVQAIEQGVGTVVLLYECLRDPAQERLEAFLACEPPWSSVPFIVLIKPGTVFTGGDAKLQTLRHAVLLERPTTLAAFVSAIRVALQARTRQYEIRDLLQAAQRASQERARLHAEALESRAAAESANRIKDEFLAVVSHELRTPLNAILGWATLLERGQLDAERRAQGIETIERNARVQAQLIEDLLDVSRIISGTLRLHVQQVELIPVLEQALNAVAPAAEAKGLRVVRIFDPDAGQISGDPARLQQVVWNLLSNAVKFTPKGGRIQVTLERNNSHVQVRVADNGRGIASQYLAAIFERFRQIDSSTTRSYGGLGLGLSIVRQLVELHGGSVTADSPGEGQGSTFTVRLPITPLRYRAEPTAVYEVIPPVPSLAPTLMALAGVKVLIIDDELDSSHVLAVTLSAYGAEVMTANSAPRGLELFANAAVDVIVCDIGMPQEDGYSVIRKIRSAQEAGERWTPAIALTAYARSDDRTRALAAGFQAHVAKPADPLELVTLIAGLSRTRRSRAEIG